MGMPRKIANPEEMERLWKEYKASCDNKPVLIHAFSGKESKHVSETLNKSITYTIEGFCVYVGLSRKNFYADYRDNELFRDTVTRMQEECEIDARSKFELGIIPSQLSGLWMGNYGYATKQDTEINANITDADRELLNNVNARLNGLHNAKK